VLNPARKEAHKDAGNPETHQRDGYGEIDDVVEVKHREDAGLDKLEAKRGRRVPPMTTALKTWSTPPRQLDGISASSVPSEDRSLRISSMTGRSSGKQAPPPRSRPSGASWFSMVRRNGRLV
jgi:hypothetical protein